jgi:large subunit ribosomal protein L22
MAEAKAQLNNYRQSPRKVRVVAQSVRGKSVRQALDTLTFLPKRAALPLEKLINSAVANAKDKSIPTDNLVIKEIAVDGGATLYRRRPMSRGRAFVIRKRTSHVSVTVAEGEAKKTKKAKSQPKS